MYKLSLFSLSFCFSVLSLSAQCLDEPAMLIKKVDSLQLKEQMYCGDSQLTIVNFWGTWCRPCLKEMPYFQDLRSTFSDKEVRLLMVSLDQLNKLPKVEKSIRKHRIPNQVLLLLHRGPDIHDIINSINPEWEGSIPYTVFIKDGHIVFAQEGSFKRKELLSLVREHLKS